MKIRIEQETPPTISDEKYNHLYLNDDHIGFQSEKDTIKKVIALITMSDCEIEIMVEKDE